MPDQPTDTSFSKIIVNRTSLTSGNYNSTFKIVNTSNDSNQVSVDISITVPIVGYVEGHVQYAGITIPISDVSVNIGDKYSTTNTDGYYRLNDISVGNKILSASKDGYDPHQSNLSVVQGLNNKEIEMTSALFTHKLSGKITSGIQPQPLQNATVTVLNDDNTLSQLQTTSDINGNYQILNVPQGQRIVKFQKQNYQTLNAQFLMGNSDYQYNAELLNKIGIPDSPEPSNSSTDQDLNLTISLDCKDTNGDALKYDVYFDTSNPPSKIVIQDTPYKELQTVRFVDPGDGYAYRIIQIRLLPATTYYWKIIAKDNYNNITEGPTWSFSTSDKFGTVKDIDGNIYLTKQIGNQVWMAENLKVTHYNNGNNIPQETDDGTWINLTSGAYSNYNNNSDLVATFGRLYNWYAAHDTRKIAPAGWHVPTDAEWQTLVEFLGGSSIAGGEMKTTGDTYNRNGLWGLGDGSTTNNSGFSGLPGGFRRSDGNFWSLIDQAYFWSSTEVSSGSAWAIYLSKSSSEVVNFGYNKVGGFSVRCVKD